MTLAASGGPSTSPDAAPVAAGAGDEPSGAEGKNWVERSICAQAAADFDDVAPPPMGVDLAAYACDGVGLTAQQLETQARAVCTEASERLALLSPSTGVTGDSAATWLAVGRVDNERALGLAALRSLDPPEAYRSSLSAAIERYERLSELAGAARRAAEAGDEDLQAQHEAAYARESSELDSLWAELGADGCLS